MYLVHENKHSLNIALKVNGSGQNTCMLAFSYWLTNTVA